MQQLDKTFDKYRDKPEVYRHLVSEVVEIVTEEVETLRVLVKNFSEFAKLPAADPQPRPLWKFVESTVRSNPQFAEAATVRLHDGAAVHAKIDSILMRRVLVNIIQNAIEAVSEEGHGQHPEIDIELVVVDEIARLIVRDNGPGISPEDAERVFEPYYTTKEIGTGLGLAIVRKIVIDHGGDIRLGPRQDGEPGAEAWIELPVLEEPRNSVAALTAIVPNDDESAAGPDEPAVPVLDDESDLTGTSPSVSPEADAADAPAVDASGDLATSGDETAAVGSAEPDVPAGETGPDGTSVPTPGDVPEIAAPPEAVPPAPDDDGLTAPSESSMSSPPGAAEPSDVAVAGSEVPDEDHFDSIDFDALDLDDDDDDFDDDLDDVEIDEDELVDEDGILRRVR